MDAALTLALDAANYILILILIGLGLAVIFGLMNVINMAHGEFVMLGAYTLLTVKMAGGGFWLGIIAAPLVVGVVGLVIEEIVLRRIYGRVIDAILATWGLSIGLQQAVVLIFGPGSHSVSAPIDATVSILGAPYPVFRLVIMAIAVIVIVATFWVFLRTRIGLAARGVIANRAMASCLGINTRKLDRLTFSLGAALAGLAGAVVAPLISIDPLMGIGFLVPAFLAIIVGGLGSLSSLIVGGSLVGGTDTVAANLLSPVWAQVIVFAMAILVIRLFPRGVMGGRELGR